MTVGALNPIDAPDDWSFATIANTRSPGCIPPDGIQGFDREDKWDVKPGKGTTGATTTRTGQEPAKGSIKFLLWEARHFTEWDRFLPLLKFDATKKTGQALTIFHPALASVDPPVASVVVTKVSPITGTSEGLYQRTVEFLEYYPPKATGASTAKGAKSYYNTKNDPGTQEDPAIKKLQQQVKQLAAQAAGTA